MNEILLHMNATQGRAKLHPGVVLHTGVFLLQGANTAYEHGLRNTEVGRKLIFKLRWL